MNYQINIFGNKISYLVLVTIILYSCNANKNLESRLTGTYSNSFNGKTNQTLKLNSDKTFYREMINPEQSNYVEGIWKVTKQFLILTYNKSPKTPDTWKATEKIYGADSIKVLVKSDNTILFGSLVELSNNNKKQKGLTDTTGTYLSEKFPADLITVNHYGYEIFKYRVKDKQSNFFIIDMGKKVKYAKQYVEGCVEPCSDTLLIEGNYLVHNGIKILEKN